MPTSIPTVACLTLSAIGGQDCIGDSRTIINTNTERLGQSVCDLLTNTIIVNDTSTINHTFNTSTRLLTSEVQNSSITNAKIAFDGGSFGFRNKVINGDMRIDQRNNGSAISSNVTSTLLYPVDRFFSYMNSANSFLITAQQITDTSNPEFQSYLRTTTNTATTYANTVSENGQYAIQHRIEGNNVRDLRFGTAQAKSFTISFWVRGNNTGTYLMAFCNASPFLRVYYTTYEINQINTWEKKTITVPGDTGGTWQSGNDNGLIAIWGLGFPTVSSGSGIGLGTWSTRGGTGPAVGPDPRVETSILNTLQTLHNKTGATFDLTGVQLELGSTATPFEHRPIPLELELCQRYFETGQNYDSRFGNAILNSGGLWYATNELHINFKTIKRTTPSMTFPYLGIGTGMNVRTIFLGPSTFVSGIGNVIGGGSVYLDSFFVSWAPWYTGTDAAPFLQWRASAEL